MKIDARKSVLDALIEYERNSTFTNLALKKYLRDVFDERDKKFISALFYGVVETKLLLDYYISKVSSVKLKKINLVVLNILRMGLYQIMFLSVPKSAACNTSVELAKNNGQYKSSGFVNAILRKLADNYDNISLPNENTKEYLSVKYSISEKNLNVLIDTFGKQGFIDFMESGKDIQDSVYAAVNLKRTTADDLIKNFEKEKISASKTNLEGLIKINSSINVENSDSYKQGLFHVIGFPSFITAMNAKLNDGDIAFDMCSAPGGKTFVMSYNCDDSSKIFAFDLHEHKINNMIDSCKRLGIKNVFPKTMDSSVLNSELSEKADVILCDVPCSGLGMIFKKPDIKYKEVDFDSLTSVQYKILSNASVYLKKGGRLIYSTCTVNKNENNVIINKFLENNRDFSLADSEIYNNFSGEALFMPNQDFSDGFFVAVLYKN